MELCDGLFDVPPGKIATVVTSLEMLERAPARSEISDAPWRLQLMPKPDFDWYRNFFRRVGTEWLWFCRLQLPDAQLQSLIHDPAVEVYLLLHDHHEIGLLELDFQVAAECELSFFGIVPDALGTGAGRWLMNRAFELVWARSIRRFWVHTCTADHPSALGFYLRSGFRAFRRQIEIADDPRLTGVLPLRVAPHIPVISA